MLRCDLKSWRRGRNVTQFSSNLAYDGFADGKDYGLSSRTNNVCVFFDWRLDCSVAKNALRQMVSEFSTTRSEKGLLHAPAAPPSARGSCAPSQVPSLCRITAPACPITSE